MDIQNNNHIILANGTLLGGLATNGDVDSSPSSPSAQMNIHNGDQTGHNFQQQQPPTISVILTIRLLMQGKEVGSIIGKRGDHIKIIRDESNAKINISDGSCPERIVTITGSIETIHKAFTMICRKFEDDMQQLPNSVPKPPITFRLIVPATQCGSLIGKGGSKIKEIREATGASIQVASEMLPNSTERAVTISGTAESIIICMHQICQILLESPPKGATIPFRPKPTINPILLATSAAAAAAAQQPCSTALLPPNTFCPFSPELTKIHPLNQLLPGFNPAVLAGNAFPSAAGVIPISANATNQQALFSPELAIVSAANMFANGAATKTGDSYSPYSNCSIGRSELDAQQKSQNEAVAAAALSQYVINSSPVHASATANNKMDIPGKMTTSNSVSSSQKRMTPVCTSTANSTSAATVAASMAAMVNQQQLQNNAASHVRQQQLSALHAAAMIAATPMGSAIGSQQRNTTQPAAWQAGFQMPLYQYNSIPDPSSNVDSGLSTAANLQHQAWMNMLGVTATLPTSHMGFNQALNTVASPFAFLQLTGASANGSALMLAPSSISAPAIPPTALFSLAQQQGQLMALQQAQAAAVSPVAGGPIMGPIGDKLTKRFTPY